MSTAPTTLWLHLETPSNRKGKSNGNDSDSDFALPVLLPRLIDDAAFWEFSQRNKSLRVERSATGETEIMAPSGAETGFFNGEAFFAVRLWNRDQGNPGYTFDSSAGFRLPSGAVRSPDVSWVRRDRWEALTQDERERFAPLCPDFVIELLSPTDSLNTTQEKMLEYQEAGAVLGWLIDRRNRRVYVYRPGQAVQELENPGLVSGDPELPGLQMPTERIF